MTTPAAPRTALVPLLAAASGIAVADNYYLQPLLALIARDLGVGIGAMGVVSSLALLGYALGLLLVVPLGDVVDRRPLVTGVLGITTASLLTMAVAPSVGVLAVATFGVGLTSVVAQVLVPYAAQPGRRRLSRPGRRQTMMSGILTGILGARVVAGCWVTPSGGASCTPAPPGLTGSLLLVLLRRLPAETDRHRRNGRPDVPYREVLARVGAWPGCTRACRVRAAYGFCGFGVFSAVWTSLAFHLRDAYGLGPSAVAAVAVLGRRRRRGSPRAGRSPTAGTSRGHGRVVRPAAGEHGAAGARRLVAAPCSSSAWWRWTSPCSRATSRSSVSSTARRPRPAAAPPPST